MPKLNKRGKIKPPEPSVEKANGNCGTAAPKNRKAKRHRKDPTDGLSVLNPNAAAIDLGAREHWVAIPPDRGGKTVRQFGCFTSELEALAEFLVGQRIDTVVMEATGNYWVVLYELLEQRGLRVYLVNARYAKNMQGRKTDLVDCQWMQRLHSYGLFTNSFRPPEEIRVLRTFLRQRENLVAAASQSIQYMQKALTEMNLQLTNVISDISGMTGLAIIDAILQGERDPESLVRLKDPRIRASNQTIRESLRGHWKPEQLFVLEQARLSYAHYQEQIAQCDERIQQQMKQMKGGDEEQSVKSSGVQIPAENAATAQEQTNEPVKTTKPVPFSISTELKRIVNVDLTCIDGIGPGLAQVIVSEIGTDMSAWPTDKHFASWLGLCPEHRISGGRILSRHTRPVASRARTAFRIGAYTLERSQSAMGAKYRRLKKRLGAPKAIVAMANHLAKLVYRMIKFGHEYVDKGMKAYEARFRKQQILWLQKKAEEMKMKLVEA
jgi:transposase